MILLLVACGGIAPVKDHVPSMDDTGDSSTDTDPRTDDSAPADDTGPGDSGTTVDELGKLLAQLRDDPAAAMLDVSRGTGWPAPVEGGYLFVCTMGASWQLAGDHSEWSSEGMTQEEGFSWLVRPAEPGGGYKFTDGADWVPDPWSRAYRYDDFGEMSNVLDASVGHLERQFDVEGDGVGPRTLHLYVPAGGHTHTLYAMDGQNLFDPGAFWGGWHLDASVPAGVLIVGIDNTAARTDEYTHTEDFIYGDWYGGDAASYGTYVEDVVRPLVAGIYGTEGVTGLLGSSLGGLVSFAIADQYPDEFAFAGSMSGTMGWGSIGTDNPTMIEIYAAAGHRGTALYLDSGGGGSCYDGDADGIEDDDPSASDNYCENLQLRGVLEDAGYLHGTDLWHWWEPGAEHNEAAWAERVFRPLEAFAGL